MRTRLYKGSTRWRLSSAEGGVHRLLSETFLRRHSTMRKLSLTLLSLVGISALSIGGLKAVGGTTPIWPAIENQLAQDHVQAGTALEKLVRANQDFSILRPEEANDKLLIPLWLRVEWRRAHPEGNFAGDDPTGGYPLVLREVAEWMVTHQNLQAPPEA